MTNETIIKNFWPDGIRLVISVSMQFEAGGQPPKGTDSPFPKVEFPESVPSDAAANWVHQGTTVEAGPRFGTVVRHGNEERDVAKQRRD